LSKIKILHLQKQSISYGYAIRLQKCIYSQNTGSSDSVILRSENLIGIVRFHC